MGARREQVLGSVAPIRPAAPASARPPDVFIPRPRVQTLLDDVPAYAATVIVAPAGSGKTAAVAAYSERARAGGAPVTWLRPEQVDLLTDALGAALDAPGATVLVLDDAHLLSAEGATAVAETLADAPESVRLVLMSRQELTWLPVGLQLAGTVRSVPADDLRFRDAEALVVVRAHHPAATDADVAAIVEQSDGWAAALVLASRALRAAGNAADARAALAATRQPLLDYLTHEVFETFPPDLVRVLVTTCQQEHVSLDEATLLSGIPHAGELLDQAAAAGLLVTAYRDEADGSPTWRYHPLLRDLVRHRAAPTGPDWPLTVEAHRRASAEYVDRRDAERALTHARLSGDLDLQLEVLRDVAGDLVTRRRTAALTEALAAIPAEVRSSHDDLLVLQATVLRAEGRLDDAKVAADRALAAVGSGRGPEPTRDVEAELAALEVWQARCGWREPGPALERARRALGCRHDDGAAGHDLAGLSPVRAHWLMLELGSLETWLGDLPLAAIHVQDAAIYSSRVDVPVLQRAVLAHRAMLELVAGAYQSSLASAETSLALRDRAPGPPDVADARADLVRGWAQLQQLDLAGARGSLAALRSTPRELWDPLLLVYGRLLRACVLAETGRPEEARRLLDGHGAVPGRLPAHIARDDLLARLLIKVAMGDLAALERITARMRATGQHAAAALGDALVLGLRGEEQRAVRTLEAALPHTVDGPAVVGLATAVARVGFLHRIGTGAALDNARALTPDLLSRAAPQRLLWILSLGTLISPGFVDLVGACAEGPDAHPFAAEAYDVLRRHPRSYPDLTRHRSADQIRASDPTDGLLTPREREVLEQLALGGANSDLARALFVSENTVKTHLASIYRKLGVERRADALREARARGML